MLEMDNTLTTEFLEQHEFMLEKYGSSPFNPTEFYTLEYNTMIFMTVPLNFAYLNYYLQREKNQFDKNVLHEIVTMWLNLNEPNLSMLGKLFLETHLIVLLGEYVKNEYILRGAAKYLARSYKKKPSKRSIDPEARMAIKKLPYLRELPDNKRQLDLEYQYLMHGNRGLSIRTIFMEKQILEWIQKIINVPKNKIFDLFIACYHSAKLTGKLYSNKTIEKRIDRLNSDNFKKKINRLIELEKLLF